MLLLFFALLVQQAAFAQKINGVRFTNDYKDVYHLALIIYTPDGKMQTRVSNLDPGQEKMYVLPPGTEIFVADWKAEQYVMQGNDVKVNGAKPTIVLKDRGKYPFP
ncbi:hypothetical protein EXU57_23360 [Segetibacter sp. 3557_3]|uniref:hypothetical protein n=1 Tax=Segetibacter sp. 3557_3 TaxID=2547429 RepID=UPI00105871D2|nr:hypothetical protein [Segetibacter sp. 3557_3]TDH18405.1 hypothetical protein EXU57_23360 [Segetibacter sp. 3557_3]